MAAPQIPFDIVEAIIEEVSFDTGQNLCNLKSCALTCRNFLNPSQRRIFDSITVSTLGFSGQDQVGKLLRLQNILSTSPHIARYVHTIDIYHRGVDPAFIDHPCLPNVFSMLKNVTTFRFKLFPRHDWSIMTPQLQQILITMLSSSTLETLSLSGISHLPLISIKWIRCITDVSLSTLTFEPSMGKDTHISDPLTRISQGQRRYMKRLSLQSYIIHPNDGVLRPHTFQPLIDCISPPYCTLETLTVDFAYDFPVVTEILKKHASSLTTLNLPINYISEGHHISEEHIPMLNIGTLPCLRTIRLHAPFVYLDTFDHHHFRQIISKVRQRNNLQNMTILLHYLRVDQLGESARSSWNQLDTLLSEPQFEQLKEVYFTIYLHFEPSRNTLNSPKIPLWSYLPRLHKRGLLKVHNILAEWVDVEPTRQSIDSVSVESALV
ncbi:hypothetical protein BDQ17DRAFT_1436240 [Cyathus striatus]|nr:hypothetical protein BDQ17DRAFT_1436240 [Cyathus striatus]